MKASEAKKLVPGDVISLGGIRMGFPEATIESYPFVVKMHKNIPPQVIFEIRYNAGGSLMKTKYIDHIKICGKLRSKPSNVKYLGYLKQKT